jgi:uncharacterized protein
METRITFHSERWLLEGQISPHSKTCAAVITHPHPLYGGDLSNPVVEVISQTYARKGLTTLRFNFRGVGKSEGAYGSGVAEQQDVLAAIEVLAKSGIRDIHLAGYSFGAWVNGHIPALPPQVSTLVLVAPPVALMDYSAAPAQPLLKLVIAGSDDEIAPPESIKRHLPAWNPASELAVIDDADHFFFGRFRQLEEALADRITAC